MSKQLTPMQELIEWMDKNKGHCTYGTIRLEANKLLPAERKMVEDAYKEGFIDGEDKDGYFTAEYYFTQTYQS